MKKTFKASPGSPYPMGAKLKRDGVNFSIFSRHATSVELLLYENADSLEPIQAFHLESRINKTFYSWHILVHKVLPGTWYTWRMDGPDNTSESGLRFDKEKHLLDPLARVVSDRLWNRGKACLPGDNGHTAMRSLVADESYDWEGDTPFSFKSENAIIYELHVGGFTRSESSSVKKPGTFSALIEKIPYLKALGITHVELLPIMAFDEQDIPRGTAALGLKNYWGYSTHSFFSPHPGFCVTPEKGTHIQEFRDLVKALHKAEIGIIMDVVFNHTSEAGADGPVINFRGIGSSIFYHLEEHDKSKFRDYTGCGNTVNANHPVVANFIISCLEYWVREMHVDGFRFDLASALARGQNGEVLQDPPVLWGIELSEQLAKTKLIAEAWDAAGLYQVGSFPGYRWGEWNGKYRDSMRRFIRGDRGLTAEVATRLCASSDLYKQQDRLPINSINFITCHDGFTLYDMVSYHHKHNLANGEDNRDGGDHNMSYNCGAEGATDDANILELRRKQAKNSIAILLLSQGVPMLLAGDEVLNTQNGNNNGYCQDNELTWFDWSLTKKNVDMLQFVQQMIALRKRHTSLMRRRFLTGECAPGRHIPDIQWHGVDLGAPQWLDSESQVLAFTLAGFIDNEADLHVILNMSENELDMQLPIDEDRNWHLAIDTALNPVLGIITPENQIPLGENKYSVPSRSVVVFEGR
ncbi:glycogen debranching protein GlgX [Methyloprofundus sp.]|uniref:glycogen debranching protein GlgX n=1 Tax=Methyloprofundus sp. TaxID=2020875 RepID=UPI003D12EE2F